MKTIKQLLEEALEKFLEFLPTLFAILFAFTCGYYAAIQNEVVDMATADCSICDCTILDVPKSVREAYCDITG